MSVCLSITDIQVIKCSFRFTYDLGKYFQLYDVYFEEFKHLENEVKPSNFSYISYK